MKKPDYEQTNQNMPKIAWERYQQLEPQHKYKLQPSMQKIMQIRNMGELGAVELLYAVGTFLNMREK